jgi:uncharacterized Fe-S cluster protein YjdI
MSGKPRQTYATPEITVTFDPDVCQHTGVCLRALPAVFDVKRKRWIRPGAATSEEVAAAVARCPSGALRFFLAGSGEPHEPARS